MKQFTRICILDKTILPPEAIHSLAAFSRQDMTIFNDRPASSQEAIARIGDADAVLLSRHTPLDAAVLMNTAVKYIGLCNSLYTGTAATIDMEVCRQRGIFVTGVADYSDGAVIEFILAKLVDTYREKRDVPAEELEGKKIGIIGYGHLGSKLAARCQHFGMEVFYYSRSKHPEAAEKGINWLELPLLLSTCDIISLHVPRQTLQLTSADFEQLPSQAIFVNTSLGKPFEAPAFYAWFAAHPDANAILDLDGAEALGEEKTSLPNVYCAPYSAGYTRQALQRLSDSVTGQLKHFLQRYWL